MNLEKIWDKPMDGWDADEWKEKAEIWKKEETKIFHALRLAGCPKWCLLIEEPEETG